MAKYLIGDVQGCDAALEKLLQKIDYSPSRDVLFLLGDLVNRGGQCEAVLKRLVGYGNSVVCVLGNHDLHFLALAHGVRAIHKTDTLQHVLDAPQLPHYTHWLRHQHMAHWEDSILMVHAGVLPTWNVQTTLSLAGEVESQLRGSGKDVTNFLKHMYGETPKKWNDELTKNNRLRTITNALTRLRFCTIQGEMDFDSKESANQAPPNLIPWFDVPNRATADVVVAFGHWSTLGWLHGRSDVYSLDGGCVWGGCLHAYQFFSNGRSPILHSIDCVDFGLRLGETGMKKSF